MISIEIYLRQTDLERWIAWPNNLNSTNLIFTNTYNTHKEHKWWLGGRRIPF